MRINIPKIIAKSLLNYGETKDAQFEDKGRSSLSGWVQSLVICNRVLNNTNKFNHSDTKEQIDLDRFCFSDLVKMTELKGLENELINFEKRINSSSSLSIDLIHRVFQNIGNRKYSSTSFLSWKKLDEKLNTVYLKHCNLSVRAISDSLCILTFIIEPTELFKEYYKQLLQSKPSPKYELYFDFETKRFNLSVDGSIVTRYNDLNKLFKKLYSETRVKLLPNINFILQDYLSVPKIEVIDSKFLFDNIPNAKPQEYEELETNLIDILSGYGIQYFRSYYTNNSQIFGDIERINGPKSDNNFYFVFDSSKKNNALDSTNLKEDIINYLIQERAIISYLIKTESFVSKILHETSKSFQSKKIFTTKRLKDHVDMLINLESFSLEVDRLESVVDRKRKDLPNKYKMIRKSSNEKDTIAYLEDIREEFDKRHNFINRSIREIGTRLNSLINLKETIVSRRLQQFTLIISAITLFIIIWTSLLQS